MPSAAWLKAAKKTPMQPVIYAACESVDAINVTQKLASDWNSGTIENLEVFALTGLAGDAGVRPAVHESLLTATSSIEDWEVSTDKAASFTAGLEGYLHSAKLRVVSPFIGDGEINTIRVHILDGTQIVSSSSVFSTYFYASLFPAGGWDTTGSGANVDVEFGVPILLQTGKQYRIAVELITAPYSKFGWLTAWTVADSRIRRREIDASIVTAAFDLGTAPNINSRILIDETVSGDATLTYTAEGSSDNSAWTALGAVSDGKELPPYRYYRVTATFHGTPYHTPELYQIRIVGGNRQYTYIGTHRNEPVVPSGEVLPYLDEVSSLSSKIGLKEKSTVGDITLKLAWMPETADLVQATGKRRNISLYIGFVGLPLADYEPYFSGIWESYTADAEKRSFSIKLRDVWKKLKKEIPEQQIKNGVAVDTTAQFGKTPTGNGTTMNIIDAIIQVCDMAKAPDRYIDKAALSALKSAYYSGAEWNVYRLLTEKLDSDDLLNELSTMAGLFLIPAANGQLTPKHYDTLAAATPTVVLDAAQIKFSELAPDMAGTVTRHNIYYGLIAGKSPGSAESYTNVYSTIGSENTVIAERDREEIVVGEWFDNWGLAMSSGSGATNPITRLGDRLLTWYTPIATVSGKKVATTKTSVKAESVPLRYYGDVEPGNVVYVDNLRLPCPKSEWGGFSNHAKFLILRRDVDSKKFTITLELFQLTEFTYNTTPSWASYDQLELYPSATSLTLTERNSVGVDGVVAPSIAVSFDMPATPANVSYEVWYSADGAAPVLFTAVPSGQGTASLEIPAATGISYTVNVVVANGSNRQPLYTAPTAALDVTGAAGFATPANTGLQVVGGGTVSSRRDFSLTWDAADIPATLMSGYLVEILSTGNVLKRTVQVTDNHYTYTYGMNLDDFGTPTASFNVRVSTINANGAAAIPLTVTVSNSAPSAPTDLAATAQFMAIQLDTAYSEPDDFACVEVWAAVTNDRSTAAKIAEIKGATFTHTNIPDTSPRYYWVRVRDLYGNTSGYYPSGATSGVSASTAGSPAILLSQLSNQITASQLHADLSSRIDQIDEPTTGLVSQVAAAQAQLASVTSQLDDLVITAFDTGVSYAVDAKVRYETNVYKCIQATTAPSPLPTDTDYWELIGAYAGDVAAQVAANAALAQSAADTASTAATNASSSATSAAGSASAANTSSTLATTAKDSAQGYASAASASASSAAGSATDAATRATAAASSATTAATQAGQAQTYANQASNSATSAAGSANSASTSQGAAATSATNAANSATASSTSAGQAATSATNAANSATASQASRVAAETARDSAQGQASAASTSASAASVSASNAASSATSAAGSATTATTQAGTAQSYAGQAASSATNAQGSAVSAGNYSSVAASSARSASLAAAGPLFLDPLNELCVGIGKAATDTPLAASSTFSVVSNTSGVGSGQALSVAGSVPSSYLSTRKIHPVAMGRTYRLTMRVRKYVNGAGSLVYGGIVVMGADYSVLVSDSWVLAPGVELSVANGWMTYSYDYTPASASHKYLQLTSLVNYSNGAGTTEISQLSAEDVTESSTAGGHATAAATSASTASTSAGQAGAGATAAATSATQAATDRAQAGTYASQASTAAGNAATAATQAQTYASNASGYAATASSAAATADEAANRYSAQYTLKVDANGNVAGIGLFSDNTTGSAVEILADRFAVTDGTNTIVPFIVSGGNVYINSAYIQSLNANKILFTDTTNGHISLGKSDANDSTAGFWLGNVGGVAKFAIGNATNMMKWDGSTLDYTGRVNGDRVVSGSINLDGTVARGSGFTSSISSGVVTITFTTPFASVPTMVVTPASDRADGCYLKTKTTSAVSIQMTLAGTGVATSKFDFLAFGS